MFRHVLLVISLLWLAGCASVDQPLLPDELANKPAVMADRVPIIPQADQQCAAAALAMALQAAGLEGEETALRQWVFTPGRDGALPPDLISAARRSHALHWPVQNLEEVYSLLAEDIPTVALLNIGTSWWPQWHYGVVTGLDPMTKKVTLHAGLNRQEVWQLSDFIDRWQQADHWGIAITTPSTLPPIATPTTALQSAVALEKISALEAASTAYQAILQRWPSTCIAAIGLGNTSYRLGKLGSAKTAWQQASNNPACTTAAQQNLATLSD